METVDILPKHVVPGDNNNNQEKRRHVVGASDCGASEDVFQRFLSRGRCLPETQTRWFCSRGETKAVHPEALQPLTRTRRCDQVETWRDFSALIAFRRLGHVTGV